jgi:hypothetical protein
MDKLLNFHQIIANKITNFLDNIYYNNLKKLYNDTLSNTLKLSKFPVIKPELFVYMQYYFMYLFLYYVTNKRLFLYTVSLHLTYISGLIFKDLSKKYEYVPIYNIYFLKDTSYLLFMYLLFFKIFFLKIQFYNKIFMYFCLNSFYALLNINFIYKERLKCIEENKEFRHTLKFLIISPEKSFIEKVIYNTRFFNYSNFLFLINILIYIFN